MLRILTPSFRILDDRWNDQLDLVLTDCNGEGTHKTEVHVFSGASKFQQIMFQRGTVLEETDETWAFGMVRGLGGWKPDLYAIQKSKTRTKHTKVHVLRGDADYQQFVFVTDTDLRETGPEFDFVITDWSGDGLPDLVAIKKAETRDKCAEVHVLSGASTYKDYILCAQTPWVGGNFLVDFAVADWTTNGKPDMIALKKSNTGTNLTEMHVMEQQY